jgi:hypothetical protein
MAKRLSRKQLYELVWSEPMKILAPRFGISDVALKKTCARADIPTPGLGHWAKKAAGKSTSQVALAERPPGMDDEVLVGAGVGYWHSGWSEEELLAALPPPPEFGEQIDRVRERIAKTVGKLTVPRDVRIWHPAIDRLLKEDDQRRERHRASSFPSTWDAPLFDTPSERRRLRVLNTLVLAAGMMNGKPAISDHQGRSMHFSFYQRQVGIRLDRLKRPKRRGYVANLQDADDAKLSLSILQRPGSENERIAWQDDEQGKVETRITEIAIQIILTAEVQYREGTIRNHEWRVQRKAELEAEKREKKRQEERAERERQKWLEQARIDRLLKSASAFQQAGAIRKYVEAIRLTLSSNEACSPEELELWSQWALSEADRIDPAIGGAFLTAMRDEEGAQDGLLPSDE